MKAAAASALIAALSATTFTAVHAAPVVDETYPYNGPTVPVGDWVDQTVNGNGKGFPRLVEAPAVKPKHENPTNNINVISLAYLPKGINIHYQTPFGLGEAPKVKYGTDAKKLHQVATGYSHTYDRTPPCSSVVAVTQCSQFFHEVQLHDLMPSTKYYYQILAANGTTESDILSFTTSRPAGTPGEFSLAVLNDMGYTNAGGTFQQLNKLVNDGAAFAWHGGDLSYADDWYSGILPCEDDWPVCYNGTSSELPAGDYPESYNQPLPEGEIPNQGGPQGGDMSVLYESNWDLWQQWMVNVTTKVPYMTALGNHEAACAEFDGPGNPLTALLNDDQINGTAPKAELTYFSCPPSQRNFTAYQHRFWSPGNFTGGVGNMWYSFDYGLAHFITLDAETDFVNSPEWPFARDLHGNETFPQEKETYITDSGPFGRVSNYSDNKAYEQYQWLKSDLEKVDRSLTPWIFVMAHRPMYSSAFSSYMTAIKNAWQDLLLEYEVDAYLSGHIHWYERMLPLTAEGKVEKSAIVNNNTYYTVPGKTLTHLINGMAGNIESHSTLSNHQSIQNITAFLDQTHYGLSKMTVFNSTAVKWEFVRGDDGSVRDYLWLLKKESDTTPPDDTC